MTDFFETAYEGTPTWDIGRPQPAVVRLEEAGAIVGSVLDVGCGTGENSLYLAAHGHPVLGIDRVRTAIAKARHKAAERGLRIGLLDRDALELAELGRTFDTALDVGLFHTFDDDQRPRYAQALRSVLAPGGRAFLLCWSERNPWGFGPRRVTRQEIRDTFAEGWRIASIEPETLDSNLPGRQVHAWLACVRPCP